MTAAERLLLVLLGDLALAKDGAAPLEHVEGIKKRIKEARHALDSEAFYSVALRNPPPPPVDG